MPGKAGGSGGSAGGGAPAVQTPAGTFSAGASSSGTAYFSLDGGFLTELSIRINGDLVQAATTGGPVLINAWLRRGPNYRQLCKGLVMGENSVKGSGQLPIQSGSEIMVRWTNMTAAAVIVKVDAFVDVEAKGDSAPGWLDETRPYRVFWSFHQVCVQDGAGGGTLQCRVTPAAGSAMRIISMSMTASGNRAVSGYFVDADAAAHSLLCAVGAAAGARGTIPAGAGAATTNNGAPDFSADFVVANPSIAYLQVEAAAQTETATVDVYAELIGTVTAGTTSWAASGGTPNVAAATENTLTGVVL